MQATTTDIICKLKAAVAECRSDKHDAEEACHEDKPSILPVFLIIPVDKSDTEARKKKSAVKCVARTPKCEFQFSEPTEELKFPEMRNGILFDRCYCVHRDGLQDSCPLNQCQGHPNCLVKPWSTCLPAKYLQSRHPQQYPPTN